jgi:hypothetical protein
MVVVAGLLVALVAVLLVLEPVLRAAAGKPIVQAVPLFADSDDEDDPVLRRRDQALAALREIEFDLATGKLSEEDHQRLLTRYQAEALEALRAVDEAKAGSGDRGIEKTATPVAADEVEWLISRARAEAKGRRQRFCEECGAALEGSGKFCVECGSGAAVGS